MKIALFLYDFFVDAGMRLADEGYEILHVFTTDPDPEDNFNSNIRTKDFARKLGIDITFGKPEAGTVDHLLTLGCELGVVMGYPHLVPIGLRSINLHPTLLPEGRGPFPLPWLILRRPEIAGLTLHKVSSDMDAGDILIQTPLQVDPTDNLRDLMAKLQMAAPQFVSSALKDIENLWAAAKPQGPDFTYWRAEASDWTINWDAGVEYALRQVRAFGELESVAIVDGQSWAVTDASGWLAEHRFPPGQLVHRMQGHLVIAAHDGFVLLNRPRLETDDAS